MNLPINTHALQKKGQLKIYLGFAAGVGKTYAMLKDAHFKKSLGADVVCAYINSHQRAEVIQQAQGLEILSRKYRTHGDSCVEEIDVEVVLRRRPDYVLVDDLADSSKRYSAIQEVLDAGIHVLATLNVQNLESIAYQMQMTTGFEIKDRIPDSILKVASEVVAVDISIEELRERVRLGKIFPKDLIQSNLEDSFSYKKLSFFRECMLREAACDQTRRIEEKQKSSQVFHETVMVCLSSDPIQSEALIRRGTKMANQFAGRCYVVTVQNRSGVIDPETQQKNQNNLSLARGLGAEVINLQGDSVAETLVNFAIEKDVRHAIFGKSRLSPFRERLRGSVISGFIHDAVGVDVHILSTVEGQNL